VPPKIIDDVLVDLARHPGWAILEERMKAHHEDEAKQLASFLIHNPEQLDQLRLARERGFWAGQRWHLHQVRHELAAYIRREEEAAKQEPTE
jgi:hypothetical protein